MTTEQLYEIFLKHPVITTDTRDCPEGSIFFALKGASFNGNSFAVQALQKGCAYAVVDEDVETPQELVAQIIKVEDVLTALQQLAHCHRKHLGTRIIGVTGTNGKTTTKELIAAVLSEKYNVHYTKGNFNNHIGVPKTLLLMTKEHDIAVIEMGANHPGEIKTLVDIVEPDYGIITNVGRAHLGGFGSFEGVKATKGELYDFLASAVNKVDPSASGAVNKAESSASAAVNKAESNSATTSNVFINADSDDLMQMAEQRGLSLIKYGTVMTDEMDVFGKVVECKPTLTFSWIHPDGVNPAEFHRVETKLIGDYNIHNMLAAATIGLRFGVSEQQVCHALESYTPSNNRSQLTVTDSNKLVVDAYNANPTSMAAALNNFKAMQVDNKMVILGSMGELGEVSRAEHEKVIENLKNADSIEEVWLVGDEFAAIEHPFRQFADVEEVKAAINTAKPTGKYILIKGSNSQKLFQLPELL